MKIQPIKAHRQEPVNAPGAKAARIRILIGSEDGAAKFHMRHFEVEPGGCTPHHQHDYEHEILVLAGGRIPREVGLHPDFHQAPPPIPVLVVLQRPHHGV